MAESVNETAAVDAADTAVALDLAPTQAAELAWSSERRQIDDIGLVPPMPLPVEPSPWRAVCRYAIGVFAACIAVAGGITAADRHWFAELRGPVPAPVAAAPSSTTMAAPTEAVAQPEAWTLPPVPAVEHLREPQPADELPTSPAYDADVFYLNSLRRLGLVVVNPYDAIASGHWACSYMRQGHTSWEAATIAMSNNPSLSPIDAKSYVVAASAAYCPDMTR